MTPARRFSERLRFANAYQFRKRAAWLRAIRAKACEVRNFCR
jgi:hypothetical protein